jgi:hypothetical protein
MFGWGMYMGISRLRLRGLGGGGECSGQSGAWADEDRFGGEVLSRCRWVMANSALTFQGEARRLDIWGRYMKPLVSPLPFCFLLFEDT